MFKMRVIVCLCAAVSVVCARAGEVSPLDLLLPQPQKVEKGAGTVSGEALACASVVRGAVTGVPAAVSAEAYELAVGVDGVKITASDVRGERYARVTLAQLVKLSGGNVPACVIRDWPALRWRGYMNDCGRNYLAPEGVKAIIDMMAAYKMNLFHWHLSDYHGWRLESKKYPQLNRPEAMLRQRGKFYTQEEFREIVRYAAERGVTVMPELDVPGHTLAFRRGMGIDSMSAPGTDRVITELLEELCSLAPADVMPFVHLGTDEVRVKPEYCDESWPTKWARALNAAGRKAVVWAPGERIDPSCDVIDMAWHDNRITNSVNSAFDAARLYNTGWTPFEILPNALFRKPWRWAADGRRKLGAITCTWHDDNVGEDTLKLFKECPVFPSIVALSDTFWHGRATDDPEHIRLMPLPGTAAFNRLEELERRIVAQRDCVLFGFRHPFPFIAQTKARWRVTDCETGKVVLRDVPQGTFRLKNRRGEGLVANSKGRIAAETWIFAPTATVCGAWIDMASVDGVYGRLRMPHTPRKGEWNAFGGKVELNGEALPPPEWKQPGMKASTPEVREQDVPWSTDLMEKPLVDEMPALREAYPIRLKAGWNHVRISMEVVDSREWDRAFSFMPILGTPTHPREVPGLKFRCDPPEPAVTEWTPRNRWAYFCGDLARPGTARRFNAMLKDAKAAGYNGVMVDCRAEGSFTWDEEKKDRYRECLARCAALGMDFVPLIWSVGYGYMLDYQPDLVETVPMAGLPYTVKGGRIVSVGEEVPVSNPGFEQSSAEGRFAGWATDRPGTICFTDRKVSHSGGQSLRVEPRAANGVYARVWQTFKLRPFTRYRFSVWAKTDVGSAKALDKNLKFVVTSPVSGTITEPRFSESAELGDGVWRQYAVEFFTSKNELCYVFFGAWNAETGRFWLDDAKLEVVPVTKVPRGAGAVFQVENAKTGAAYVEGKDFLSPPPMDDFHVKPGEKPIVLDVPAGSELKEGDALTVTVSLPVGARMYTVSKYGQYAGCMSDPALYRYFERSAAAIQDIFRPRHWMLSMDEIRAGGTCAACKARKTDMAHILGDCVTRQCAAIRAVSPGATIYMWSDQLDPWHNAVDNYFSCEGSYKSSADLVPKDVVPVLWGNMAQEERIQYFSALGFRVMVSLCFDNAKEFNVGWLDNCRRPNCLGVQYTTWIGDYNRLKDLGRLLIRDESGTTTND